MHIFITSRRDCSNGLLCGLLKNTVNQLHLIQNSSAWLLPETRRRANVAPIFKILVPVSFRIDFRTLLLAHGAGPAPGYIRWFEFILILWLFSVSCSAEELNRNIWSRCFYPFDSARGSERGRKYRFYKNFRKVTIQMFQPNHFCFILIYR